MTTFSLRTTAGLGSGSKATHAFEVIKPESIKFTFVSINQNLNEPKKLSIAVVSGARARAYAWKKEPALRVGAVRPHFLRHMKKNVNANLKF